MESRKYTVCRDDVFVGSVVRTDEVFRETEDDIIFSSQPGELTTGSYRLYRTMLFVPDRNNFASDLLFNSPNYTALNVSYDEISLATPPNSIVVKDCFNLEELLRYFGYPSELTYEDIVKIRKRFFTGHFAMDNCELFGWKESMPQDFTYYKNGEQITNPAKLRLLQLRQEISRRMGHRMFSGVEHAELDRRLWDVLDKMGDNSIFDIMYGFDEKMDAFRPHKEEVNVFRLTR